MPAGGPAGPWYGTPQQGHPQQGNQYVPGAAAGPLPRRPAAGTAVRSAPVRPAAVRAGTGQRWSRPGRSWSRVPRRPGTGPVPGPYGDGFAGQGPGGFAGPWPGAGFVPGPGDPAGPGFAGPGACAGGSPGYPPPGQFPGPTGPGQGSPGGPYQGGPVQAGPYRPRPAARAARPGAARLLRGGHGARRPAGRWASSPRPASSPPGQAFHGAAPAAQFAPGWAGRARLGQEAQAGQAGGSFPAGHGGQGGPLPGGPWPGDGQAGNARPGPRRQIDDDPDRVLTPTTIFAPGSLVNPPDGAEGDRRDSHPFAGPGGAPPGYGPFPGQGPWPAPGGYPQPGPFPGPGAAPGPGTRRRRVRRAGRLPARVGAGPGDVPRARRLRRAGPFPPGTAFPVPGGFPANGGTAGGSRIRRARLPGPRIRPAQVRPPVPGSRRRAVRRRRPRGAAGGARRRRLRPAARTAVPRPAWHAARLRA